MTAATYRVVTTTGRVLAMRLDLLDACARAHATAQRRRSPMPALVVRDTDDAVMKLSTPIDMNDSALWARICRAQPDVPRGELEREVRHRKRGGRSDCDHPEWQLVNGSDYRCTSCGSFGWQLNRLRYGMRLQESEYPVIARVCASTGCKRAATAIDGGAETLRYFCDLHDPSASEAAK